MRAAQGEELDNGKRACFSLLKLFIFILAVCVCVNVLPHIRGYHGSQKRLLGPLEPVGAASGCEPSNMGTRDATQVL